jgi:hypothetical protein
MRLLTCLGAIFLAAAPASAAVLQWNFTGAVNDDVVASLYPLAAGTTFSGSIRVDTGAASHPGDPAVYGPFLTTVFDPGSATITIDLAGQHIVETAHIVLLDAFDNAVMDELDIVPDGLGPFDTHVAFRYFDGSSQTISGSAFPATLPLGAPRFADIYITGSMWLPDPAAPPWIYQFTGHIDTLAPVPEPATWALMLIGFGAVGAGLRRRRPASASI